MAIDEVFPREVVAVRPFDKMPVDAGLWNTAHGYHDALRIQHNLAAHRPGILAGLEVVAHPTQDRKLIVSPGVALDHAGNILVRVKPIEVPIIQNAEYCVYVALNTKHSGDRNYTRQQAAHIFAEKPDTPGKVRKTNEAQLKNFEVLTSWIELARISATVDATRFSEPQDPDLPGKNEVNRLLRTIGYPYFAADGMIADFLVRTAGADSVKQYAAAGLSLLAHESAARGCHIHYAGTVPLSPSNLPRDLLMLYASGSLAIERINENAEAVARALTAAGGMVVLEGPPNSEFERSARQKMATVFGAQLELVRSGHPLLRSLFAFPDTPAGATAGEVWADLDKGIVVSTRMFGQAWRGSPKGCSRADVGAALEFGLNILATATTRRHRFEALALAKTFGTR